MASQYPPEPPATEPFGEGPDDPAGGPPLDEGGPDRRWIWPAAAFAAVAGILVAVLVVVLVSDDDGDDEEVVVPTETVQMAKATPNLQQEIQPDAVTPTSVPEAEPEIEVIETRAIEPPVVLPRAPKPRPVKQVVAPAPAREAPPDPSPAPAPEAVPVPPSPAPVAQHGARAGRARVDGEDDFVR